MPFSRNWLSPKRQVWGARLDIDQMSGVMVRPHITKGVLIDSDDFIVATSRCVGKHGAGCSYAAGFRSARFLTVE
jgi:hypothetical protein